MNIPKLSFCITCMNRLNQIKETLPQNLRDNILFNEKIEFIVVDFATPGLQQWIKSEFEEELRSGYLKYYYTEELRYWHASIAKNTAHLLANNDILVNLDCDNYTGYNGGWFVICQFLKYGMNLVLHQESGDPFGGYWWLAKFCPLSSLLIVLNQQLVKSCTMRQNFDGTKMGQNRRKIKPRPLCSEYPYQNTLVPSTKVQICPVKNEQMNLFLSFITHFSIILYHDRFFKVSDTLLHVLPLNNVSLIIVHCSRQMPIIRIGICTLLLSDLIQILRL